MRAIQLDEFDGPLHHRTVPVPEPGMGEVLLRVGACAVDQFDLAIRNGRWSHAVLPLIIGHEIAGEVVAAGPELPGGLRAIGWRPRSTWSAGTAAIAAAAGRRFVRTSPAMSA